MPRKKLPIGKKKIPFIIYIEGEYITEQNREELQTIAYKAIVEHLKLLHQQ